MLTGAAAGAGAASSVSSSSPAATAAAAAAAPSSTPSRRSRPQSNPSTAPAATAAAAAAPSSSKAKASKGAKASAKQSLRAPQPALLSLRDGQKVESVHRNDLHRSSKSTLCAPAEDKGSAMYHKKPDDTRCDLRTRFRGSLELWTCARCQVERGGGEMDDGDTYVECGCQQHRRVCWTCEEGFCVTVAPWQDLIASIDGKIAPTLHSPEWGGVDQPTFAECATAEKVLNSQKGRSAASVKPWRWSFLAWVRYMIGAQLVLEPRVVWAQVRFNGDSGQPILACMLEEQFKAEWTSFSKLIPSSNSDRHGDVSVTCTQCGPSVLAVSHCSCNDLKQCHEALCYFCIKERRHGAALEPAAGVDRFKLLPLQDSHRADADTLNFAALPGTPDQSYIPECTFLLNIIVGKDADAQLFEGDGTAITAGWNEQIFSNHAFNVGYRLVTLQLRIKDSWVDDPLSKSAQTDFDDAVADVARCLQECGLHLQKGIIRLHLHSTQHRELLVGNHCVTLLKLLRLFVAPFAVMWNRMRHKQHRKDPAKPIKPRLLLMLQACGLQVSCCTTAMRDALTGGIVPKMDWAEDEDDALVQASLPDINALLNTADLQTQARREDADASFEMVMYKRPVPIAESSAMLRDTLLHYSNRVLSQAGPYQRDYTLADILRLSHAGNAQSTDPVLLTWDCAQSDVPEGNGSAGTPRTSIVEANIWRSDLLPVSLPVSSEHPRRHQPMLIDTAAAAATAPVSAIAAAAAAAASAVSPAVSASAAAPVPALLHPAAPSTVGLAAGTPSGVFVPRALRPIPAKDRKALICSWLEQLTAGQRATMGWTAKDLERDKIVDKINDELPCSQFGLDQLKDLGNGWVNLNPGGWAAESAALFIVQKYFTVTQARAGNIPGQYAWNENWPTTQPAKKAKLESAAAQPSPAAAAAAQPTATPLTDTQPLATPSLATPSPATQWPATQSPATARASTKRKVSPTAAAD